jgi:hypothetical protein
VCIKAAQRCFVSNTADSQLMHAHFSSLTPVQQVRVTPRKYRNKKGALH